MKTIKLLLIIFLAGVINSLSTSNEFRTHVDFNLTELAVHSLLVHLNIMNYPHCVVIIISIDYDCTVISKNNQVIKTDYEEEGPSN